MKLHSWCPWSWNATDSQVLEEITMSSLFFQVGARFLFQRRPAIVAIAFVLAVGGTLARRA